MSSVDGWEGLSPAFAEPPKADEIDLLYGLLFNSAEGQKVVSHLRQITIEQPSWFTGEDANHGCVRTGMTALVLLIQRRIERSNNV